MLLYIQDRIALPPYFEIELLAAIFSAIAYGTVVVLAGNCVHLLQKKRNIYPNRMRILLSIYVIVMLLSSTWRLIGSICQLMDALTPLPTGVWFNSFGLTLMVTMWGADGFMIWRCLVLYQGISGGSRVVIIVLLSLISIASFVCGLVGSVEEMTLVSELAYADRVFISLSALVNIILGALIVFRLGYHRRYIRNALGAEHGSPYTNSITMCVESSALMVISTGLHTILRFVPVSPYGAKFMFDIIPHICVISPLLIICRVAMGRAIPPTLLPSEQVMAQIQASIPLSNSFGQEGEV